jgi:magnesium-protoporphyrin O-methyltransferase
MGCCQCQGIEAFFNKKLAVRELGRYLQKGPWKTTRMLIEAIRAAGLEDATLLDIGGGIGAIQHELLSDGASRAVNVDASSAYLEAAKSEAQRRGHTGRVTYHHGDFVDLAQDVPPADVVTLDRVICCYHDVQRLVGLSAAQAKKLYGLVYPRDTWWVKAGFSLINLFMWALRNQFRGFVHPSRKVEAIVRANGLERHFYRTTLVWQVVLYARSRTWVERPVGVGP